MTDTERDDLRVAFAIWSWSVRRYESKADSSYFSYSHYLGRGGAGKCEHAVERDEAKPARGVPAQEDREDFEKNLALTRKRLEDWNERCSALEKMARLAADEKTLFDILCMNAARISAGQDAKERARIISDFNDPANLDVMILVCSCRSAAESYNFQKACHNIILMDVVGLNIISQIIGRCYRIGQKHEQYIQILTANLILANHATAMVAQLAATSGSAVDTITDADCLERLKHRAFQEKVNKAVGVSNRSHVEEPREIIYDDIVHAKFLRSYGVRSDRDKVHWRNGNCMDAKLLIAEEREFYLSKGGRTAERLYEFFKDQEVALSGPSAPSSKGVEDHLKHLSSTKSRADSNAARAASRAEKEATKREKQEEKEKKERKARATQDARSRKLGRSSRRRGS
ncbi:hypothetical protein LTR35_011222 [Friedmanniomyces endolithicus]|uniref:Helicase C-terminal domain-containing protein n=1 Tax=Friedmanniomyces endolithicus TaxID=329885 RepID=A0AAN6FHP4_9PEZI|nr:hypothetical protein LTR35_011222 [Friedmanniomyces endolithicus]KAK0287085.1 hypothetical protein LTS00_010123 [Friedmanniomyces endolithicus]KAK0317657.1 hypothetical protein LTR82_011426 [Friedmanniomyces endolithicus]KAK0994238.1 hypothetical protein LTR54_010913 [Friedmanniomyces endolithicus]